MFHVKHFRPVREWFHVVGRGPEGADYADPDGNLFHVVGDVPYFFTDILTVGMGRTLFLQYLLKNMTSIFGRESVRVS